MSRARRLNAAAFALAFLSVASLPACISGQKVTTLCPRHPVSSLSPLILTVDSALLLRVEEGAQPRMLPQEDDLDPAYLLACRVLVSHNSELRPGERVDLLTDGFQVAAPTQKDKSPCWLIFGENTKPMPQQLPQQTAPSCISALDFNGWSGEILLHSPHPLTGVWKQRADGVRQEHAHASPQHNEPSPLQCDVKRNEK